MIVVKYNEKNSNIDVFWGVRRKKNVTMTQLDMEELKVEMNTFKEKLRLKNDEGKKPAALSENRLKIQAMRKELEELKDEMRDRDSDSKEEIDSLKKKLKERESDEGLYYDSLQHDFELDRRSLYSELYFCTRCYFPKRLFFIVTPMSRTKKSSGLSYKLYGSEKLPQKQKQRLN